MNRDRKTYRVMVVEDNPGDLTLVEDFLLEQILHPVIQRAESFRQASQLLLQVDNTYDVILLDLSLPDKQGADLLDAILQLPIKCPIIILTGFTDIEFSIRSISLGIYDYLVKDDLTASMLYKSIIYTIERYKSLIKLTESEKRYSDLFYLSPEPKYIFDPETFCFVQVNIAMTKRYGYSQQAFMNMNVLDIVSLAHKIQEAKALADEITFTSMVTRELEHQKSNGEIISIELHSSPILIGGSQLRSVIAIDITEKKQADNKITRAIIKTQEDDRYQIGSELHDNVCQLIVATQISLGMIEPGLTPATKEFYDKCKEYLSLTLKEARNLSHQLAPVFFEDISLQDALRRLLESFHSIASEFKITVQIADLIKELSITQELQLNLYRIVQEQLTNIVKHAKASSIRLEIFGDSHVLQMKMEDNGVGFDMSEAKAGIGMANMKRRVELFSGKFAMQSSPGEGCMLTIQIPLSNNKN